MCLCRFCTMVLFCCLWCDVLCFRLLLCRHFDRHKIVDQIETFNKVKFVSILQIWNHMYYSHYRFFKYASLEPCHYAINFDDASFINVFSEFGYEFQSNVLLV